MMRACYISLYLAVSMLAALIFAGCDQRELCYDHTHTMPVSIEFDWTDAPDAAPATMVVWFFPVDGSQGLRFELMSSEAVSRTSFNAVVEVPVGTYHLVCHNGSTEFNVEQGSNFNDYMVTTYDVNVLAGMSRNENAPLPDGEEMPVRSQASPLYAHTLSETLTVDEASETAHKVVFRPAEASIVCDVSITHVQNLSSDIMFSAVLTGASEGWYARRQEATETRVAVPFAIDPSGPDSLHGTVVLFGLNGRQKLRIYTSYKYYYDFDVTDQIEEGKRHINIDIAGIKLLETPPTGMRPGVSDWNEAIEEDITM